MSTKIEFCHETINPLVGCSRKSLGCANCYALRMARRHEGNPKTPQYHGITRTTERGLDWTGEVRWVPGVLEKALVRLVTSKARRRIFVCSMSDIAHEKATLQHLANVYAFAAALPRHPVILITKRPDLLFLRTRALMEMIGDFRDIWDAARKPLYDACWSEARDAGLCGGAFSDKRERAMLHKAEYIGQMLAHPTYPVPNVMLMATVEDQERLEERIEPMMKLAARGWHTGLIAEPILGRVAPTCISIGDSHYINALTGQAWDDENGELSTGIDGEVPCAPIEWFVCGMEQGPQRRAVLIDYPMILAKRCAEAGTPFFFKKLSDGSYPLLLPRQFPAWMLVEGEAA